MQLVAIRPGGVKCSSACPYYEDKGQVRDMHGVPMKTHCRATMQNVIVDCDVWNPRKIEKLDITEEEWATFQKMLGRKAKRERKPYPDDHAEIHPVGCEWTRAKGKWNAIKSKMVNGK